MLAIEQAVKNLYLGGTQNGFVSNCVIMGLMQIEIRRITEIISDIFFHVWGFFNKLIFSVLRAYHCQMNKL